MIYGNAFFLSWSEQTWQTCYLLVQMAIYGESSYLGHLFQDRLEYVIAKYSKHPHRCSDWQQHIHLKTLDSSALESYQSTDQASKIIPQIQQCVRFIIKHDTLVNDETLTELLCSWSQLVSVFFCPHMMCCISWSSAHPAAPLTSEACRRLLSTEQERVSPLSVCLISQTPESLWTESDLSLPADRGTDWWIDQLREDNVHHNHHLALWSCF